MAQRRAVHQACAGRVSGFQWSLTELSENDYLATQQRVGHHRNWGVGINGRRSGRFAGHDAHDDSLKAMPHPRTAVIVLYPLPWQTCYTVASVARSSVGVSTRGAVATRSCGSTAPISTRDQIVVVDLALQYCSRF